MMYKTNKVFSIAPASTVGTSLIRNGILLLLPQIGAFVFVVLIALNRFPAFAKFIGILYLLHLPAFLLRKARSTQLKIDTKTVQVTYKPALHIDNNLLTQSLVSLTFFMLCGLFFFMIFS